MCSAAKVGVEARRCCVVPLWAKLRRGTARCGTFVVLPAHSAACRSEFLFDAANHSSYVNFSTTVVDNSVACEGFYGIVIGDGGFLW
ncbi:Hypothetical predicted protein [Olea europaea subsp. europaea]|uniref:Uncharacterized protein n=1 Tax=Olea europaea subsp. europaea TaxID=158383 RepID=A0A8S0SNP2_OLEEU|nr:Hypothetical predicted protein [Olea europaea subsp. europaea]